MSKFEKKFGKYAIPNLTMILIACYIIGYIIQLINADFLYYLTLDPVAILHGQVWRVLTWLLVPPESFDIFTVIMLIFYYNIGTLMERTLGTYRYNVYLVGGILMTVLASFLCTGVVHFFPEVLGESTRMIVEGYVQLKSLQAGEQISFLSVASNLGSRFFSTYYMNIAIFLAFAVCYPNLQVLLMFVIPVKVKWMGILDLVLLGLELFTGNIFTKFAVGAALLNFLLFYLQVKNLSHLKPTQIKRRMEYQREVQKANRITRHKCAICGQTEETAPDLEFRFCSKCNGNYEYCENHLYTHEHVK